MLRHIAKNLVANGYAKKCEIQISYAIGVEELIKIIKEKFNLTPRGIIEYLNLKDPIYTKTTNYGHFGKKELPWEKIIKI